MIKKSRQVIMRKEMMKQQVHGILRAKRWKTRTTDLSLHSTCLHIIFPNNALEAIKPYPNIHVQGIIPS
jgi:hypothetical protein